MEGFGVRPTRRASHAHAASHAARGDMPSPEEIDPAHTFGVREYTPSHIQMLTYIHVHVHVHVLLRGTKRSGPTHRPRNQRGSARAYPLLFAACSRQMDACSVADTSARAREAQRCAGVGTARDRAALVCVSVPLGTSTVPRPASRGRRDRGRQHDAMDVRLRRRVELEMCRAGASRGPLASSLSCRGLASSRCSG